MPRCKPKRFHRYRKPQVIRRKKKRKELVAGTSRNRKKRPKNKNEQKRIEESV